MTRIERLTLVVSLVLLPAAGDTQPLWDATAAAGLLSGHRPIGDSPGFQDDWFHAAQGAVIVGRQLRPHLKVELEASASSGAVQYVSHPLTVPGSPYPYWMVTEETTWARSLGAVAAWQFRDNEWVHPFVLAGVAADVDRTRRHVPEQFLPGDSRGGTLPRRITESVEEESNTRASAVVGGGAKLYFRERAFVRSDVRLTFDRDRQNLAFRAGVGLEF